MTIRDQALAALQPPPGAPASAWATRITACWQASVKAILEVGSLLAEAKEALDHGDFGSMIETDLPFTARTAQMLMAISADPRLTNPKHVSLLPPHWGTLYELTKLDDKQFDAKVADGTIRPDLERKDVPRGARAIMGSRQEPDDSLDYFPTPPWAVRALIEKVLRPHLAGEPLRSAWEPACGEGHIAEVLREYFPTVVASDIHGYGYGDLIENDFLAPKGGDICSGADWIITNPPFGDKTEQFVLRAIERANVGVAMFVRLQWLESIGRYEAIFRDSPPTLMAFFAERVNLCKGRWEPDGTTATAYIWLCWIRGAQPRAPQWIPPGQRDALKRDDDATRFTAHPVIMKDHPFTAEGAPLPHDLSTGEIVDDVESHFAVVAGCSDRDAGDAGRPVAAAEAGLPGLSGGKDPDDLIEDIPAFLHVKNRGIPMKECT